jgi:hypothetical protein
MDLCYGRVGTVVQSLLEDRIVVDFGFGSQLKWSVECFEHVRDNGGLANPLPALAVSGSTTASNLEVWRHRINDLILSSCFSGLAGDRATRRLRDR